jgi:hypothetical protein
MINIMCDIKDCGEASIDIREFIVCKGFTNSMNGVKFKKFDKSDFFGVHLCNKHRKEFAKLTHDWVKKLEKW